MVQIRPAVATDARAVAEIYRPIVEQTAISFELTAPDAEEIAGRIASAHLWLVATDHIDQSVVGFAYATSHRARAAYRYSVETSVYLADSARGRGVGTLLYRTLLPALGQKGFANAYAGIVMPNASSVRLHERVGFAPCGLFPRVGWKLDAWHDLGWWHRPLADVPGVS